MKTIHCNSKRIYITFKNGHLENYINHEELTYDNLHKIVDGNKVNLSSIAASLA